MANVNTGLYNLSPEPIDKKQGVFENGKWRPFLSIQEALAAIPAAYRHNTLRVWIGPENNPVEYWFKGGTADSNLVVKDTAVANTTAAPGSSTSTQPPVTVQRYATLADVGVVPNAALGDYLIMGPTSGNSIQIRQNLGNTFTLDTASGAKKILIKGGNYGLIYLDLTGMQGKADGTAPIIITNYSGQVRCEQFVVVGIKNFVWTGKYDPVQKTGDPLFQGHAGGAYAYSADRYGFVVDGGWKDITTPLIQLSGGKDLNTNNLFNISGGEVSFVEIRGGGLSNFLSWNDHTQPIVNMNFHDLYIHDIHSVGLEAGSANPDYVLNPDGITQSFVGQGPLTGLSFHNNRVLRAGEEALRFSQLYGLNVVENNVLHGGLNWKSPQGDDRTSVLSLSVRGGGTIVRYNMVVAGGGHPIQVVFNAPTDQNPPTAVLDPISINNNAFLYGRGIQELLISENSFLPQVACNVDGNYWGYAEAAFSEVYTGTQYTNTRYLVRLLTNATVNITNNTYDGSAGKNSIWATVNATKQPVVNTTNNSVATVQDASFVNYLDAINALALTQTGKGFNYNLLEQWAARVGYTWGDETNFPSVVTQKFKGVSYGVGDYVSHRGAIYRCILAHKAPDQPTIKTLDAQGNLLSETADTSQTVAITSEPGVSANWQNYWSLISFGPNNSVYPPDDVRNSAGSFYELKGIGLSDRFSTTSSSSTIPPTSSSTTVAPTTTTTSLPPDAPTMKTLQLVAFDRGTNFFLKYDDSRNQLLNTGSIVGVGSSSLAGNGASNPQTTSYAALIRDWMLSISGGRTLLYNIAKAGQDTTNVLPVGTSSAVNEHNSISAALAFNPSGVIIALPSNDIANGIPEATFVANTVNLFNLCRAQGIPAFVLSCQPRTALSTTTQKNNLYQAYQDIKAAIPPEFFVDTWPLLVNPNTTADIDAAWDSGDGIHVNDAGHQVIFFALRKVINAYYQNSAYTQYVVEQGVTTAIGTPPASWTTLETVAVTLGTEISRTYPRVDGQIYAYRVKALKPDATYTVYSNVVYLQQALNRVFVDQTIQIDTGVNTNPAASAAWNALLTPPTGPTLNQAFALTDINGVATGVTLTVTKPFPTAAIGGADSGIYESRVMQGFWSGPSSQKSRFQVVLSGLQARSYKVDLIASFNSTDNYRGTAYSVGGSFVGGENAKDNGVANQFHVISFDGVQPDGSGNLTLDIYALGANAYLNAIVLSRYMLEATTTTTSSTTAPAAPTTTLPPVTTSTTQPTTTASTWAPTSLAYTGSQQAYVYTPASYYGNGANYPLIIFLHGPGQAGSNIASLTSDGLPAVIAGGQEMQSLVFCPQAATTTWSNTIVKAAYDYALAHYRVDPNRVYVTGFDSGSDAAFNFVKANPTLVAAWIGCSSNYSSTITTDVPTQQAMVQVPVWLHHAFDDASNNANNPRTVIRALNGLSPAPLVTAKMSLYPTGGHTSAVWNGHLYNKSTAYWDFEKWLLLHSKDAPTQAANYVSLVENLVYAADYSQARIQAYQAQKLVSNLSAGATQTALQNRLAAMNTILGNYARSFVLALGATTAGNVNSLTSGATGQSLTNLVDSTGAASTYGFTVVQKLVGTTANATEYVDGFMNVDLFGQPGTFNNNAFQVAGTGGTLKFTGLDNTKKYNLVLIGTYGSTDIKRGISLTVGTTVRTISNTLNTQDYIYVKDLSPVAGEISLSIRMVPIYNTGFTPTRDQWGASVAATTDVASWQTQPSYLNGIYLLEQKPGFTPPAATTTSSTSLPAAPTTTTPPTTTSTTVVPTTFTGDPTTATADEYVYPYGEEFAPTSNLGFYANGWGDSDVADLIKGVNLYGLRTSLQDWLSESNVNVRATEFTHYQTIGLRNLIVTLGEAASDHHDPTLYGTCTQTAIGSFLNIYEPIWNGDGTVNTNNYFANYVQRVVNAYKGYGVRVWEVVNEPDFTGVGDRSVWLTRAPLPNEMQPNLCMPFFHYMRMLRIAHEVVRKYAPGTHVAPGGFGYWQFWDAVCRYTDNPGDPTTGAGAGSVTAAYPKPGSAYIDCISYHVYPWYFAKKYLGKNPDGTDNWQYFYHSDRAKQDFSLFFNGAVGYVSGGAGFDTISKKYGYDGVQKPKKHYIISETNVARWTSPTAYGSNEYQRNYMIKAMVQAQKLGIKNLCIFTTGDHLDEPLDPSTTLAANKEYNLMGSYNNLEHKVKGTESKNVLGWTMQTYGSVISDGWVYDDARTTAMALPAGIDGAAFKKGVDYKYILWAVTTTDKTEQASGTYSFPASFGLTNLHRYEWNYSQNGYFSTVPSASIPLTGQPSYFEPTTDVLSTTTSSTTAVPPPVVPTTTVAVATTTAPVASTTTTAPVSSSTTAPAASTTTAAPAAFRRILVDFGGDGVADGIQTDTGSKTPNNTAGATGQAADGNWWNNVVDMSAAATFLPTAVDTTGAPVSGFSAAINNRPGGTFSTSDKSMNFNGPTVAVSDYPVTAVQDNTYFHTSAGLSTMTFVIPAGKVASIKFWGSRSETTASNRYLQLKLATDTTWQEYNASNNSDYNTAVTFSNLSGTVQIQMQVNTVAPHNSTFGHISVIDITLS